MLLPASQVPVVVCQGGFAHSWRGVQGTAARHLSGICTRIKWGRGREGHRPAAHPCEGQRGSCPAAATVMRWAAASAAGGFRYRRGGRAPGSKRGNKDGGKNTGGRGSQMAGAGTGVAYRVAAAAASLHPGRFGQRAAAGLCLTGRQLCEFHALGACLCTQVVLVEVGARLALGGGGGGGEQCVGVSGGGGMEGGWRAGSCCQ